ncbi:MAG: 3-methyl-2-oxobutanoate hydroxymethyltransferase [Candidatus Omnitrophica bacterium]|nr:3-methyl-2-oxobutanoate hydroxymethyltransferase [Candidatus Omnitrophota bacterium]MDD5080561.1 3-methyl-2-oxobutanoate hydroxymethyltransferase [Candidatus Omnitrophota bacterium]MDD5441277.1 3-methyl-2-oxobutanoate hydroxymethyltransferase [Candidatus Omnitrophota bacterium]
MSDKLTVKEFIAKKNKTKLSLLTCYDYSFACIFDKCGLDALVVGDSLTNVVLGLEDTRKISLREMLNHVLAVSKGAQNTMIIVDMPYKAYQVDPSKCVDNAKKLIAAGADAVKVEWFPKVEGKGYEYVIKKITKAGIPVMGHIGLTPQTAKLLGGFKVQGKTVDSGIELIEQACRVEKAGAFGVVLECVPADLAKLITEKIGIPTIGIGAGKDCDGQVLVSYDVLGIYQGKRPKFARVYADLSKIIKEAVGSFIDDVCDAKFPSLSESFTIDDEVLKEIKNNI